MEGTSCTAEINGEAKTFGYDECFWSYAKSDPNFANQETVFNSIGRELLSHSLDGYNCCLMAYGQTGAGKSFSMMGSRKEPGLIPQIVSGREQVFEKILKVVFKIVSHKFQVFFSLSNFFVPHNRTFLTGRSKERGRKYSDRNRSFLHGNLL